MFINRLLLSAFVVCLLMNACNTDNSGNNDLPANGNGNGSVTSPTAAAINYSVVKTYPHDTSYFTQGFEFYNGTLYESTGAPESFPYPSWIGKINLQTGKMEQQTVVEGKLFGEGITIFNDKLYLITWQSKKGFVYDVKTMKKLKEFTYNTEGWGLTHDSSQLIMGDGSSNLYYLDPETLRNTKILGVTDHNGPVSNLNELEYIDGYIYANQWQTPYILKIDPVSGRVVGRLDLSGLVYDVNQRSAGHDYLNGIAWNPETKTLFVTGKRWPNVFEIRL